MLVGAEGLLVAEVTVGLGTAAEDTLGTSISDLLTDSVGSWLVKLTDEAEGLLLGLDPLEAPLGQKVTVLHTHQTFSLDLDGHAH